MSACGARAFLRVRCAHAWVLIEASLLRVAMHDGRTLMYDDEGVECAPSDDSQAEDVSDMSNDVSTPRAPVKTALRKERLARAGGSVCGGDVRALGCTYSLGFARGLSWREVQEIVLWRPVRMVSNGVLVACCVCRRYCRADGALARLGESASGPSNV